MGEEVLMGLVLNGMSICQVVGTKCGRQKFKAWVGNCQDLVHNEAGGIKTKRERWSSSRE
jgi:hypothetical protein